MDDFSFISQKKLRPFYEKNKNKIRGFFIANTIVFCILIDLPLIAYFTNSQILDFGGSFILTLTKILFIIVTTPATLIAVYIGYRLDQTKYSKVPFNYPNRVEILGLLVGITLGLYFSVLWIYIISLTQGTYIFNPFLYATFPVLTSFVTYLTFKGTQLLYSKMYILNHKDNFIVPIVIFILAIPFFVYTLYSLKLIATQIALQNQAVLSHFQEVTSADRFYFVAGITVPVTQVYNVAAFIGSTAEQNGIVTVNGVSNFNGLDNYLLYKGTNTFSFQPNTDVCPFENTESYPTHLTIYIRKLVTGQYAASVRKTIEENIVCNQPKE